ncbi:MAG: helix-hairpin-helix domain-containing protein [Bacteroidia bacterium]|nr:helix-hairpin-helix domain-containing protein [Bacteroidia bacterium]
MKKRSRFTDSWKSIFTFSASEKRGIYFFLIVILILSAAIFVYRYYPPAFIQEDYSAFEKQVDEFLAEQAKQDSLRAIAAIKESTPKNDSVSFRKDSVQRISYEKKNRIAYFEFDPNNLPDESWKSLGMNDGQIRVINNYQLKGGKFRKKEDLKKIHVISEKDYARLEPYVKIKKQPTDTTKKFEKKNFFAEQKHISAHIDISIADTIELQAVKGIGPSRARGIFFYRQKLGGFYSIQQLHEVFGIDSAVYAEIAEQVFIKDTSNIRRLNINTATIEQLGAHPYIRKKLAELIVNYRMQHGNYTDVKAIRHLPLVNDDLYFKLAPYLKTQ